MRQVTEKDKRRSCHDAVVDTLSAGKKLRNLRGKTLDSRRTEAMSENPTVLLVDDEPLNLKLIGRVLSDDYQVLSATTGADALRRSALSGNFPGLL
ncbi:MAG: hypothetical protein QF797_20710 [Alphaproteobacteria bacterium]|jgi:PleD family two-component response regulator|nr:hypothetical protein [Alphaproteobacteria bacterium]MDP6622478.1 hypothetical protein [Alphaproteobacteria bacterium]|tara:strand:- start:1128 stop:1415 length:288 start_codon:yes stop_codon:yes gene_type:complete